ncbi:baseplate J/gp47 family protein [Antarcticirhabdus aurantiaca]|uniref:baseplate J/gp47 family protein n=1 Tax=Antarcticirhabdus aurantiaca TaxID=2606717 RepID=UPI00131D78CD|nr:baseplate J/gp47 family protein [Antarcticirhabdus aurantiaca]
MRAPTAIDLSRVAVPDAIVVPDFEGMHAAFVARFLAFIAARRGVDPSIAPFDVESLETDPAIIAGEAFSQLRVYDRQIVNDAVRAVLAPSAKGADLDNIAAAAGVLRLVLVPVDPERGVAAVMESDASLLRRYLLAFDKAAAGSADRFVFEALTAWPALGRPENPGDVSVVGRAVHGRRGDVDIVVSGPGGRDPTPTELGVVRAAVTASHVAPEAVAVNVLAAKRRLYAVRFEIEVPEGPDKTIVATEAARRVRAAADARRLVGGEVPAGLLHGAAYGPSVIKVRPEAEPLVIAPDAYTVPICTAVTIAVMAGDQLVLEVAA